MGIWAYFADENEIKQLDKRTRKADIFVRKKEVTTKKKSGYLPEVSKHQRRACRNSIQEIRITDENVSNLKTFEHYSFVLNADCMPSGAAGNQVQASPCNHRRKKKRKKVNNRIFRKASVSSDYNVKGKSW